MSPQKVIALKVHRWSQCEEHSRYAIHLLLQRAIQQTNWKEFRGQQLHLHEYLYGGKSFRISIVLVEI
jgi:hypothetical protein